MSIYQSLVRLVCNIPVSGSRRNVGAKKSFLLLLFSFLFLTKSL